jgi:hypothetical protein
MTNKQKYFQKSYKSHGKEGKPINMMIFELSANNLIIMTKWDL